MFLRPQSDIHLEFFPNFNNKIKLDRTIKRSILPVMENEKDQVLCIAGDLGNLHLISTWKWYLELVAERFKAVIYTCGNHEFYGNPYIGQFDQFKKNVELPDNVYVLEDDFKIIDNVLFVGSTFWTSMNNRDPLVVHACKSGMNDYNRIKCNSINLTPEDTIQKHFASKTFIWDVLKFDQFKDMKKVVVTHHTPSFESVSAKFKSDLLTYAFSTEYYSDIYDFGPDVWIMGHSHDSFSGYIGDTKMILNPYGYYNHDVNPKYDPKLIFEI